MTDIGHVDLVALLKECRMGLSMLLDKEHLDYDPGNLARDLIGRLDQVLDDRPHHCVACSVDVRGLYAVAHNMLNREREIGERMRELKVVVDKLTPMVQAHFIALGRR